MENETFGKNNDIKKDISQFLQSPKNDAVFQNLIKKYKNKVEYNSIWLNLKHYH